MSINVSDPIGKALERTKLVLFRPFDAAKWFKLGFCAWLATLVENSGGGGNGGGSWEEPSGGGDFSQEMESAKSWVVENQELLITVGALVLALVVGLVVLLSWLGSRGRFMFLDGVVHNRGAVARPWREFAGLGNSLFRFQLGLTFLGFLFLVLSIAVGLAIAWVDIEAERFEGAAVGGLVVGGGLLLLVVVAWTLVNLFTRDFVVPAMYSRNIVVGYAWEIVQEEILAPHAGSVVLYCLMKALLSFVQGLLVLAVVLASCCLLAIPLLIPYIGTLLLLPLLVFMRCYSLYFVEQLGGPWRLIEREEPESSEPTWA